MKFHYYFNLSGVEIVITRQYDYDSTPVKFRYVWELWIDIGDRESEWICNWSGNETLTKCLLSAIKRLNRFREENRNPL